MNQPSKAFNILYYTNAFIIVLALISPIINLLVDKGYSERIILGYYAVLILLAVTFCISFFVLNFYGALKYKRNRMRYIVVLSFIFLWIIWGSYQIIYGYLYDVTL